MYIDTNKIEELEMWLVNTKLTFYNLNESFLSVLGILHNMAVSINEITRYLDDIYNIEIERLERK